MGLISDLKAMGATFSDVTVSYRNKSTGEAIRSIAIQGGTVDVLLDPQFRNACVAVSGKSIPVSTTATSGDVGITTSGKTEAVLVAAALAAVDGDDASRNHFIELSNDPSRLRDEIASVQSELAFSRARQTELRRTIAESQVAPVSADSVEA